MNNKNLIKIEFNQYNDISNYEILDLDLDFESLESELRMIDFYEYKIESKLYRDFNHSYDLFSNKISNQISKDDSFEIYLNQEYSLYYDKENNEFHYYFEIHDINDEDIILFSIEFLDDSNEYIDNIYQIIKSYIYHLIDYNKKIFNEEN